jgi:hypothetical protein
MRRAGIFLWLAALASVCPAQTPKAKPVAPPKAEALEGAVRRGVDFLLQAQHPSGRWGAARRTKGLNIYAPVPGAHHAFRAAVTSLAISALLETGDKRPEVARAVDRGEAWMLKELPRLRRANARAIYNNWGHAYAVQALVRLRRRLPEEDARRAKLADLLRGQVDWLGRYEGVAGGWGYYDFRAHTRKPSGYTNSFMTATVLVALREAQEAGIAVPPKLVKRGLASIRRQQNPDFTYHYSEAHKWWPVAKINRPAGSLGRSQACNVALRLWGDPKITDAVLHTWLDRLAARNGWLSMGRKRPRPHESWFAVAGYFYYYGHYYAALCLEQLPPAARARHKAQLARILMPLQEKDGSWWDFPFYDYHQPYGTAYALMSLVRCR